MEIHKNKNFKRKNFIKKTMLDNILDFLDSEIALVLRKLPLTDREYVEEIRLRGEKPLMVFINGQDYFVNKDGYIATKEENCFKVTFKMIYNTFNLISNFSVYAFEEELKNGFITITGGHRVGVAGKAIYGKNGLDSIKDISSLNIRVANQRIGVSNKIIKYIIKNHNTIYHTLIVSPPQCGKTTLLRDIIRNISNGVENLGFKGLKVSVVDERSEIAGMYKGNPQNDVGVRTDVLDGFYKYDGIILLIRSMSPHVIATDELGGEKDINAIHEALKAGVKLISTVHGKNIQDLMTKPILNKIINEKIFERIIILDNSKGVGTVKDIIDGQEFKSLLRKKV